MAKSESSNNQLMLEKGKSDKNSVIFFEGKSLIKVEGEEPITDGDSSPTDSVREQVSFQTPSESSRSLCTERLVHPKSEGDDRSKNTLSSQSSMESSLLTQTSIRLRLRDTNVNFYERIRKGNYTPIDKDKFDALIFTLKNSAKACDFKISMFLAECENCRDQNILPYPLEVVSKSKEGFERLQIFNSEIPSLEVLTKCLERRMAIPGKVVDLLYWMLVVFRDPRMEEIEQERFLEVIGKVKEEAASEPNLVFKLMHKRGAEIESRWLELTNGAPTKFGYFPANGENVHTLIHFGAYPFMKQMQEGEGIWISDSLDEALRLANPFWTWGKSRIGAQLRVVALVEFAEADGVEWKTDATPEGGDLRPSSAVAFTRVPRVELVRVRYLLSFVTAPSTLPDLSYPLPSGYSPFPSFLLLFLPLFITFVVRTLIPRTNLSAALFS